MSRPLFEQVTRAIRACNDSVPAEIHEGSSLVNDLAFDSMAMVRLGVALEDELDRPILLDEWLQSCDDPEQLTVGSLCNYLEGGMTDAVVVPGG